jgi:hypothetical protein
MSPSEAEEQAGRRRVVLASPFALAHPAIRTILVSMATPQQFEDALAAVQTARRARVADDVTARDRRRTTVIH